MKTDILELENDAVATADVVVVGTGIAGAEVATYLARRGVDVLMLESGRWEFDPRIQSLNDLCFSAKRHRRMDPDAAYHRYLPADRRGVSRVRQYGGTSNVWTGKWKHLQERDVAGRSWVTDSEWPIGFETIREHYRITAKDYGLGDLECEADRLEIRQLRETLAAGGMKVSSFYWEERPTRSRDHLEESLRSRDTLRVISGATVTELWLNDGHTGVDRAYCQSLEGRRLTVKGRVFVLAAGALETARLLLASNRQIQSGIGNGHDLVGRFYSDHPKHHNGLLRPGPLARRVARELQYRPKPRFGICFALDDTIQATHGLLEHVVYLKPIYRKSEVSSMEPDAPVFRDGNAEVVAYRVKLATEQSPNFASRITLSSQRDPFGVPVIDLAWRFRNQDHESLKTIVELICDRFPRLGLGWLDFGQELPSIDNMTDAAHHIGTTRMGRDERQGVTDPDCRVYGTSNLFVAGSAVFPTCPSYSPTFTILALSRRLAGHILSTHCSRTGHASALFP